MQKLLRKFPLRLIGTIVLLLFFLNVQAQNKKLSVSYSNVSLEEVIKDLAKKTGYKFFYNNVQMDKIEPITLFKENTDVEDLLKLVLGNTPLTYRIINGHIVIKRKDTSNSSYENVKKINAVIVVTDALDHTPIAGIVGQLLDIGIYGVADSDGIITFANIPQGEHILNLQMLGYEKYTKSIILNSDKQISIKLNATSLALEEVNVVAHKVKNSLSTASEISRQALDHAQAISLQDVLEFLPGQALNFGKTMTGVEQLSFRTLQVDKNNSFGAAVIVDGVPISNNASLELQGGSVASTAGTGVDLRGIATDNIESVELIRGVPSAEYGDLSSGAIVVKSKVGKSPLNVRFKINPGIIQTSISKGFNLKKNNRIININADYLNASGDPRQKNSSVDRVNTTMSYSTTSKSKWQNITRFSLNTLLSKTSNNDPESIADGKFTENKDYSLKISHETKIPTNSLLSRNVNINIGFTYGTNESKQRKIVNTPSNLYPLMNSKENGIFEALILPNSYETTGGTKSNPLSVYAKVSNTFFIDTDFIKQRFNMGADYRFEKNLGSGIYSNDSSLPFNPTNTRTRPFNDIPALNQLAAFFEDNINMKVGEQDIKLQAGVRFTSLQIGKPESVYSLSPRINFSYSPAKWIDIKASFGMNAKTPGLSHLYPDNRYSDHIVVRYTPNDPNEQLIMYQTNVNKSVSSNLKNSTTTRYGIGVDFSLPGDRFISIEAYSDYNKSGFSNSPDYYGYYVHTYNVGYGVTPVSGSKPNVDFTASPKQTAIVYASAGTTGNDAYSLNRGIEFSMDLGRIKALNTSFYLTGAYMESKLWNNSPVYSNPVGGKLYLGTTDTPQFKMHYEGGRSKDISRRFLTTLRVVYNIPALRLVASAAAQMIWHTYTKTTNEDKIPLGYFKFIDDGKGNLIKQYTTITPTMLADKDYRIDGVLLRDQISLATDKRATINPPLFLFNLRLTKELGRYTGFSFYANNATYYQPWQHSNINNTLSERNPNIEFGLELFIKL